MGSSLESLKMIQFIEDYIDYLAKSFDTSWNLLGVYCERNPVPQKVDIRYTNYKWDGKKNVQSLSVNSKDKFNDYSLLILDAFIHIVFM